MKKLLIALMFVSANGFAHTPFDCPSPSFGGGGGIRINTHSESYAFPSHGSAPAQGPLSGWTPVHNFLYSDMPDVELPGLDWDLGLGYFVPASQPPAPEASSVGDNEGFLGDSRLGFWGWVMLILLVTTIWVWRVGEQR